MHFGSKDKENCSDSDASQLVLKLSGLHLEGYLCNINRAVRGGNQVVKPVFDYLLASGDLIRKGRGFALVARQGVGVS